jgi:hypothetical protein
MDLKEGNMKKATKEEFQKMIKAQGIVIGNLEYYTRCLGFDSKLDIFINNMVTSVQEFRDYCKAKDGNPQNS